MTEIQIQNGCLQKLDTKCVNEKEPKNIIAAKTDLGLRGKGKSTSHHKYDVMHRLKTGYQRV